MREAKGWSQAELAERAGVRRATLSVIENGESARVEFDVWERIAGALGVPPAQLVVHEPAEGKRRR